MALRLEKVEVVGGAETEVAGCSPEGDKSLTSLAELILGGGEGIAALEPKLEFVELSRFIMRPPCPECPKRLLLLGTTLRGGDAMGRPVVNRVGEPTKLFLPEEVVELDRTCSAVLGLLTLVPLWLLFLLFFDTELALDLGLPIAGARKFSEPLLESSFVGK